MKNESGQTSIEFIFSVVILLIFLKGFIKLDASINNRLQKIIEIRNKIMETLDHKTD